MEYDNYPNTKIFYMNNSRLHPSLFLDRDGVINKEVGHISKPSHIEFSEGIFELCRFFKRKFFKIVIVTNQSGIGRRITTFEEYDSINEFVSQQFEAEECGIDLIKTSFVDPTNPNSTQDEVFRRKPNPGLILDARNQLNLDLTQSLLIGDNLTDMQAGKAAGIPNLYLIRKPLIHSDYFETFADIPSCLVRLQSVFRAQ